MTYLLIYYYFNHNQNFLLDLYKLFVIFLLKPNIGLPLNNVPLVYHEPTYDTNKQTFYELIRLLSLIKYTQDNTLLCSNEGNYMNWIDGSTKMKSLYPKETA